MPEMTPEERANAIVDEFKRKRGISGENVALTLMPRWIVRAIVNACADEREQCCEAIRAECGTCNGTGHRTRVDEDGCEYEGYCDCERWHAAIRKERARA